MNSEREVRFQIRGNKGRKRSFEDLLDEIFSLRGRKVKIGTVARSIRWKKKGSREDGKFLCTNEYIYNSSNGQSFTDLSSRVDQFPISRRRFIFHCRRSFFRDRRSALLTNPSRSLSYNEFSLSRTRDVSFFPFFLFRKDTKTKTDRNFAHTCIRSELNAPT